MDIDGLGEKIITLLIKNNLVRNISDIFYLKHSDISNLDRLGDKSANNILDSINKSKLSTMSKFINGLGIRNVGQHTSKILESHFNYNLNSLINAKYEELILINEIGDIVAESITNYFKNDNNLNVIQRCLDAGIKFSIPSKKSNKLQEINFVITGTLPTLSRSDAKNLIEENGGRVMTSISKKTTFLLCGENAGSKKTKAENLNIKIIDEKQLRLLINE